MSSDTDTQTLEGLLPILSCPECRNDATLVVHSGTTAVAIACCRLTREEIRRDFCLRCESCNRLFPVTLDGIPLLWSDTLHRAVHSASLASEAFADSIPSVPGEPSATSVKAANIKLYDEIIGDYDIGGIHADDRHGARMASALHVAQRDLTALTGWHIDVGCGNGNILRRVRRTTNVAYSLGIDVSLSVLRRLRHSHRDYFAVLGDAESLPLKSNSISLLTASSVLHHLHSPERLVAEAGRVLLPDGGLFLTDFDPNSVAADWGVLLRKAYGARQLAYRTAHALWPTRKVLHKNSRVQEWNDLAEFHNKPGAGFNPQVVTQQLKSAGMDVLLVFLHNTLDGKVTASNWVRPRVRHLVVQTLSGRNPFDRRNSDTIMTLSRKNRDAGELVIGAEANRQT
jgi:ubiquinone/menaquinone biosynthesis C-methylase UbiE/uncharacterized protein YbaR (Trm112 family)